MTAAETSLEAVRALSEGRGPKKYLHTVPLAPLFIAPRAKEEFYEPLPVSAMDAPPRRASGLPRRKPLGALWKKFQATEPGMFTSEDFAAFCCRHGNAATAASVSHYTTRQLSLNRLENAGRTGRRGILFRFPSSKLSGGATNKHPLVDCPTDADASVVARRNQLVAGTNEGETK